MNEENLGVTPPVDGEVTPPTQDNTPTAGEQTSAPEDKPITPPADEKIKTFTQEQVNKIMRSRLERDRLTLLNRYGVKDRDGLDSLIGKAQSYDVMKERYEAGKTEIASLKEQLAFKTNDINPAREDDIRAYFKGKGLEFNEEALVNELATHPEWKNVVQVDDKPKTTITTFGVEHRDKNVPETEAEKRQRIFGI